jgi:hypothetical protein
MKDVKIIDGVQDCENCEWGEPLAPENRLAFDLYERISSQFVYDFHALELVFNVYALEMTEEEAMELLDRLITIHKIVTDAQKKK